MDIMGINSTSDSIYVKYSSSDQCFMSGEDIIEAPKFLVDPETIQIGWGIYEGAYDWVWDEKPGVRTSQPTPDWKRAFSVWIFYKEEGPKLWRRFSWGESQGFNQLLSMIWNDIPANKGKVAVIEYIGGEEVKFKVGKSAIPKFKFVAWVDKPAEFTTLDVDQIEAEAKGESPSDPFTAVTGGSTLTDDELPF